MNPDALAAAGGGLLAGAQALFALAVAPTVFKALPADHAGRFLRAVFPKYYRICLYLALLATAAAFWASPMLGGAMALIAIGFPVAEFVITPAVNRARDAGADSRFKTLHLMSVLLNAAQFLATLTLAGLFAIRA